MKQIVHRFTPAQRRVLVRRAAEVRKAMLTLLEGEGVPLDAFDVEIELLPDLTAAFVEVPDPPLPVTASETKKDVNGQIPADSVSPDATQT